MRYRVTFSNGEIWEFDARWRHHLYRASRYARLESFDLRVERI
jgi:hypothetical protein